MSSKQTANTEKPVKKVAFLNITTSLDSSEFSEYTRYFLNVHIGKNKIKALIDTGAERTAIGNIYNEVLKNNNITVIDNKVQYARMANGEINECGGIFQAPISINGITKQTSFVIVPKLKYDLIVGLDTLKKLKMNIFTGRNAYTFDEQENKEFSFDMCSIEVNEAQNEIKPGLSKLSDAQSRQLHTLLDKILPLKPSNKNDKLPATPLLEYEIELKENVKPVKQKCYPVSPKLEKQMHEHVRELERKGIIEKSDSEWSSPVIMVKKRDGAYRMCVDLRTVNELTKRDAYPIPVMEIILAKLRAARFVSQIDLSMAYHQIKLKKKCRNITAFSPFGIGLWQYKRLPMGYSGAGAAFQRLMDAILKEFEPYCYVYLDDIVIITETFAEHLIILEKIVNKLVQANLTINREKSHFCKSSVKYLGFIIDEQGIHIDPEKTEAIKNYPKPKTLRQLRRFLGMGSWYRKFIKDYAKLANPLTALTKKNVRFRWRREHDEAFKEIIKALMSAPVLHIPDPEAPYFLHCDASDTGIGNVLTQKIGKDEKVIAYASRALKPNEKNFSTTERESLAILEGIRKFRPYIEGDTFTVITDHAALKWLFAKKNPTGRLARWIDELMGYDFQVIHRKGTCNVVPDCLSRAFETENEVQIDAFELTKEAGNWYNKTIINVQNSPHRYRDYKIVNGNLYVYRENNAHNNIIQDLNGWKLVVPEHKIKTVLYESHNEPSAGHQGIERTFSRIKTRYYWPGMYRDTRKYVRECHTCQTTKYNQSRKIGLMGTREVTKPNEIIAADLMGSFPRSKNGMEYLLIFEDLFTRYAICQPLRSKSSELIKIAIDKELCARLGTPKKLVTDNGKEFVAENVESFLKESGIEHELTPVYHAQANPTERVNKTIKTMIRAFVSDNHKEWDKYIPQIQFAYNTSVNATTGVTPAFLTYGRELEAPKCWRREIELFQKQMLTPTNTIDNVKPTIKQISTTNCTDNTIAQTNNENYVDLVNAQLENKIMTRSQTKNIQASNVNAKHIKNNDDHDQPNTIIESLTDKNDKNNLVTTIGTNKIKNSVSTWKERIEKMPQVYEHTLKRIHKQQNKQRKHYNKDKQEWQFEIGDLVKHKNKQLSSAADNFTASLANTYIGPCTIIQRLGKNTYKISYKNKVLKSHWHASDLCKYHADETTTPPNPNEEPQGNIDTTPPPTSTELQPQKRKRGRPRKSAST